MPARYSEPGIDPTPQVERQLATEPALPGALAALDAAGLEHASFSEDKATRATEHGLTPALAVAALDEIAALCSDAKDDRCEGHPELQDAKWKLVQWLGFAGDAASAEVLMRLSAKGGYRVRVALDNRLVRQAQERATGCSPPAADEVERKAASLADFAVFDQGKRRLVARPLTQAEASDLAYFLVAVEGAGTPVGTDDNSFMSGSKPSEQFNLDRDANYAALENARAAGDADEIVRAGLAYLEPLGFPGQIDRSLEGNIRWGGGRYSYVMRDVALAAEVAGDYALSSALYRRANPGGGGCGTSVSSRRGRQVKGLIRTADAGGSCNEVVAERLLDWDGRKDSFYGPDVLEAAGFDIPRIYRGALLTRNRDVAEAELLAAIARAPQGLAAAARGRLAANGNEAWERRVWSIEGLADTLGRDGGFYLAAALPQLAPAGRKRAIDAIGAAGVRAQIGPCDERTLWGFGRSFSSQWSRPVGTFGKTCKAAYSDDDVAALYRSLRPYLRSASSGTRSATAGAAAALGAVTAMRDIRKLHARNRRAARVCKQKRDAQCHSEDSALSRTGSALEVLEEHQAQLRARAL